ncbi:hypothetical protein VTI74DRAFT_7895 [Chaetomium olivicolor]
MSIRCLMSMYGCCRQSNDQASSQHTLHTNHVTKSRSRPPSSGGLGKGRDRHNAMVLIMRADRGESSIFFYLQGGKAPRGFITGCLGKKEWGWAGLPRSSISWFGRSICSEIHTWLLPSLRPPRLVVFGCFVMVVSCWGEGHGFLMVMVMEDWRGG